MEMPLRYSQGMNSSMALLRLQVRRQDRRVELHTLVLVRRIVAYPWLLHLQSPGARDDLARRLVTVADNQALALRVTTFGLLLEELLDLRLDGLLQHLLSTLANKLIEDAPSLELLAEVGNFQIDVSNPWISAVQCRSLAHGVSSQPSLGQLMKRT